MPERVDLVVVGAAGYMGTNALFSLPLLIENLRRHDVHLRLAALIDPKFGKEPEAADRVQWALKSFGYRDVLPVEAMDDFLKEYSKGTRPFAKKILVYDSSPTPYHAGNLDQAISADLAYLGEKPLAITREDLRRLESKTHEFCCDFIETESPAFHTMVRDMNKIHFQIERMRFWRLGSTGLKKLVDPDDRGGVTGGCLIDKADHDLSITLALLRSRFDSCQIKEARASCWMPANILPTNLLNPERNLFLSISDSLTESPDIYTADAATTVRSVWRLSNGRIVDADYYFSWMGIEETDFENLPAELDQLGFPRAEWHARETYGRNRDRLKMEFDEDDARIAIIEGRVEAGKEEIYIANFLGKHGIVPWVYRIPRGERRDEKYRIQPPADLLYGRNSLARIIDTAIRGLLLDHPNALDNIGNTASVRVHRILMEIRDEVCKGVLDPYTTWMESLKRFIGKLRVEYRRN